MTEQHWSSDTIFYHIYPLGFCGAPARNDFRSPGVPRLLKIEDWAEHIIGLGCSALYLGPLFESTAHGYDTADYYRVDRRLGSNDLFAQLSRGLHRRGLRLVLDGVFNHVGRDFWAFRDVQANRQSSPYCDWFTNLRFDRRSPCGDDFSYEGWNGHYDLVKLNLANPAVRQHLFNAVAQWVEQFSIDGLRLDAADCLDLDFLRALASFCKGLRSDFWLMGEVIHGDYRRWANPETLDSVTNYEGYKGLYSSLNDANYFEIAYSLERQFGPGGLYCGMLLYNFADNHDVDRIASQLKEPGHLFPLYCLLYTMPGVPSLYYGSEWGLPGKRTQSSDAALRPCLELRSRWLEGLAEPVEAPQPGLPPVLRRLAQLRRELPALRYGDYRPLHVSAAQLAFSRQADGQQALVALNAAAQPARVELPAPRPSGVLRDALNPGETFPIHNGRVVLDLPPRWARVLV